MNGLVETVRNRVNVTCVTNGSLRKRGCSTKLNGAPQPRLIIDFDRPGAPLNSSQRRCDYLFVATGEGNGDWVAPLELKRGGFDVTEIVGQLRAGARTAENLIPQNVPVAFRPIAVFGGGIRKAERNALKGRSNWVRFHGSHKTIRLIKCGGLLTGGLLP